MLSSRILNLLPRANRLACLRPLSTTAHLLSPKRYNLELRAATMDDLMETYGSWKEAYEKDNSNANFVLARGATCLIATLIIFYKSGVMDPLWMPNLDNVIADTDAFKAAEAEEIDMSERSAKDIYEE